MKTKHSVSALARLFALGIGIGAGTGVSAFTFKQCYQEAATPLETSYCQILESGAGATLPNFFDFRRNPLATQRLLLSGPARKAGIELPGTTEAAKAPGRLEPPAPIFDAHAAESPATTTITSRKKLSEPQANAERDNEASHALGSCTLEEENIFCHDAQYYLSVNIPLKRLNPRVLSADNRLSFRPQRDGEATLSYLSSLYPHYIDKMLLIGLGDSTLSFTKFNAIYGEAQKQGEDFIRRFADMYELLKKERQAMAIKTRYNNNFPSNIASCMGLSAEVIVCDDIEQNWVYKKLQ